MRATAVLLVLVLGVPLVASTGLARDAPSNEDLVARLTGLDANDRMAAYRVLLRRRSAELGPLLVKALPDSPELGQYYGVLVLQQLPEKAKQSSLRALSKAPSLTSRLVKNHAAPRSRPSCGLGERIDDTNLSQDRFCWNERRRNSFQCSWSPRRSIKIT